MSRLTRDGTTEPVSRNQILRRERKQHFPVQLTTSRIGNHARLILTLLYMMTMHTYILYLILVLFGERNQSAPFVCAWLACCQERGPTSTEQYSFCLYTVALFSLSVLNKQDDAGQDGKTCFTRPNLQARTCGYSFSLFS